MYFVKQLLVCSNSAEIHNLLETNKDDIELLCLHLDRDPHTLINKHTHSISVIHVQEAIHKLKSAKFLVFATMYMYILFTIHT